MNNHANGQRKRKKKRHRRRAPGILTGILLVILTIVAAVAFFMQQGEEEKPAYVPEQTVLTDEQASQLDELGLDSEDLGQGVSEEQAAEYMENYVSAEDAEALPIEDDGGKYAEVVPYDGRYRTIACWGDSMTYGQYGEGVDYPSTLSALSGITAYNLGVSGENSVQIATRQGGLPMWTEDDISLEKGKSAEFHLVSDAFDGEVYFGPDGGGDYSGYNYGSAESNICVINGQEFQITETGSGHLIVDVKNLAYARTAVTGQEDLSFFAGTMPVDTADQVTLTPTNSAAATADGQKGTSRYAQDLVLGAGQEAAQETAATAGTATQAATAAQETAAQETAAQTATAAGNSQQTQETTAAGTEQETAAPTQVPAQAAPASILIPAGTRVYTRASVDRANDILILEMGSNGGWSQNYQELINQYNAMLDSVNCQYYLILGDTDDPGETASEEVNEEYSDEDATTWIGVGDTRWEATLRMEYGEHFVNVRTYLILNGLQLNQLDTTTEDLVRAQQGKISLQLRTEYDNTHLNGSGYYAKGVAVFEKGRALGYW